MVEILDIRNRILKKKNREKKAAKESEYDKPFRVEEGRDHGYFTIDDLFVDEYMRLAGMQTTMVYMSMCRHANKERMCWPSIRRLATQGKMALNTVVKSIKWLEEHGLIKTFKEPGQTTIYRVMEKKKWKKYIITGNRIEYSRKASASSLEAFRELNE